MLTLETFAQHFGFLSAMLFVSGVCGWFIIAPFRERLRYAVLVAPLAGILTVTLITVACYVVASWPMRRSAIAALVISAVLSVVQWWRERPAWSSRGVLIGSALVTLLLLATTHFVAATSIRLGEVAMLYIDGSDHLGYAHGADWVNDHIVTQLPRVDAAVPYQSEPAEFFERIPRSGSYFYLALVSLATGQSGMFAWDDALALALAAAVLAVAGVFSHSPLGLALLLTGLFTSHWFDHSRCGYLGKVLGYPGVMVVAGLFMTASRQRITRLMLLCLAGLATATSLAHSGFATALFLVVMGGTCIAGRWFFGPAEDRSKVAENGSELLLLAGIAVLATGTLARPFALKYPDWQLTWGYELPRIVDLENQGVPLSGFSSSAVTAITWGHFVLWAIAGLLAVRGRSVVAVGLLAGPLVLLAVLYVVEAKAAAFQMIGFFYPLTLCGLVVLIDPPEGLPSPAALWRKPQYQAVLIMGLMLGAHLFRFAGAAARYGGDRTPETARYSKPQMEALAAFIGKAKVDVDLAVPQPAIALLVELGRREVDIQWSPGSWKMLFARRKQWPMPNYATKGAWRIVAADTVVPPEQVVFRNAQYWVLKP